MSDKNTPGQFQQSQNESYPPNLNYQYEDEINLLELWYILWGEKIVIIAITSFFAIASVVYALSQTEIYRAEALLAPAEVRQSNNPLLGQLGAAAGIIGLNLNNEGSDQISTAMAILQSREFARQFIDKHSLLPYLMAGKWNKAEQRSVIDPTLYDAESDAWLNQQPSEWEAANKFNGILSVNRNRDTGLVTVAMEWHDPNQAQQWVNLMVADVNNLLKQQDLEEASSAIDFLQQQLQNTQLVEMQRAFYQLIESQTRIVMLADVRDDYVFRFIDPAVAPEEKIRPQRRLICIVGTMLGGMLAIMFVFIRRFFRQQFIAE